MDVSKLTNTARKVMKVPYCGAVIVAAGTASRMEGIDKVMALLQGQELIKHTVGAFQECSVISEIVVVTRPDLISKVMSLCAPYDKVQIVVAGGKDRTESVKNGLNALSKKVKLAAIHDGARPLVTPQLIDRVVRAAKTYGAAAPAIPVKDTVKVVRGGVVDHTPDRSTLQAVQTPQVFDFDLLRGAMKNAEKEKLSVTDDCSVVEAMGFSVKIVAGDERNMKVTTPMDLKIAQMLLEGTK
jgi:2-C-methyl-D-erythritol 4-phosphate cytidylyltransferase